MATFLHTMVRVTDPESPPYQLRNGGCSWLCFVCDPDGHQKSSWCR